MINHILLQVLFVLAVAVPVLMQFGLYCDIILYLSIGEKTNESLEIIELQTRSYLDEDDIIRPKDICGRM